LNQHLINTGPRNLGLAQHPQTPAPARPFVGRNSSE
jgi:hypothetical protein